MNKMTPYWLKLINAISNKMKFCWKFLMFFSVLFAVYFHLHYFFNNFFLQKISCWCAAAHMGMESLWLSPSLCCLHPRDLWLERNGSQVWNQDKTCLLLFLSFIHLKEKHIRVNPKSQTWQHRIFSCQLKTTTTTNKQTNKQKKTKQHKWIWTKAFNENQRLCKYVYICRNFISCNILWWQFCF